MRYSAQKLYKMISEKIEKRDVITNGYDMAGLFTLALRLVVGWTYFSAFWRRLVLENKLDPEAAGYIGEKFNHFLPNALGIQPMIEYMVSNPEVLWWAMVVFTIVEGVVGLLFMLGYFTRLMSIGVFGLAMGILLGAGWIGTTCLDEWQIGVLGVAGGFTLFLSGGGRVSLDGWLSERNKVGEGPAWRRLLGSGALDISPVFLKRVAVTGAVAIAGLTLFTNQYFHGGVWGTLHNKSVKPKIEIADARLTDGLLEFEIFRVEGVDVYGSFLISIDLINPSGNAVLSLKGDDLAALSLDAIANAYVAKVKPGAHSLVVPLGARAVLSLDLPTGTVASDEGISNANENYRLVLTDISGAEWEAKVSTVQL